MLLGLPVAREAWALAQPLAPGRPLSVAILNTGALGEPEAQQLASLARGTGKLSLGEVQVGEVRGPWG